MTHIWTRPECGMLDPPYRQAGVLRGLTEGGLPKQIAGEGNPRSPKRPYFDSCPRDRYQHYREMLIQCTVHGPSPASSLPTVCSRNHVSL